MNKDNNLLVIDNLSVQFRTKRGPLKAVSDASLTVHEDESVAVIGESGSGKTTLASAIIGILPLSAEITQGSVTFHGPGGTLDLLHAKPGRLRQVLWKDIAMMFQASQSSFNPVKKIKMDFIDTVKAHDRHVSDKEILDRSRQLLSLVMLDADRVLDSYPHELSGGMKQRALLALALLLEPRLVILDEPTTALDLLTQDKIIQLLKRLKEKFNFSYLFITHDLSIVAELAEKVVVMYGGKLVEEARVEDLFLRPRHPYTFGLIGAIPRLSMEHTELRSIPGSPPDLVSINPGCPFAARCPNRLPICIDQMPPRTPAEEPEHSFACWNPIKGE